MPYIDEKSRLRLLAGGLSEVLDEIQENGVSNGDLNFIFSMLGKAYIKRHGLSYNTGSDIIKALECAKLEFYRRVMVPYEDEKHKQNGDVYT